MMKIAKRNYSNFSNYISALIAFVMVLPFTLFVDILRLLLNILLFIASLNGILFEPDYSKFVTCSKEFPVPLYRVKTGPRSPSQRSTPQRSTNKIQNSTNNTLPSSHSPHVQTNLKEELEKLRDNY